ncbi:MAG: T9SS type A sorting domain-containing protein, partial [Bacteroidota bacterium]
LKSGWNWVSFNLDDPDLAVVNDALSDLGTKGEIIKNQSAFDLYDAAAGWYGTLTLAGGMKPGDMYKLYLKEASSLQIVGSPVSTRTNQVSLRAGWNHLGYIPQFKMTLQEALVNMTPTDGDLIKTENEFAQYSDALGWVGSLDQLEPGQGYMVYVANPSTLEYPAAASLAARGTLEEVSKMPFPETAINETGDNMSIVAKVANLSSLGLGVDNVLVALSGEEIVGYVSIEQVNEASLYFLTVSTKVDQEITFAIYDIPGDTYYPLDGQTSYRADQVLGSIAKPFVLTLPGEGSENLGELVVAPNPFIEEISIYIPNQTDSDIYVTLIDLNGRTILHKQIQSTQGGTKVTLTDDLNLIKKGLYILSLDYDGDTHRVKMTRE